MKTFIVHYTTNYGLAVMIINAKDELNARKFADGKAWPGYEIQELNTNDYGIVFYEGS